MVANYEVYSPLSEEFVVGLHQKLVFLLWLSSPRALIGCDGNVGKGVDNEWGDAERDCRPLFSGMDEDNS